MSNLKERNPNEKRKNGHHAYSPSKLETYERCPCFEQDPDDPNKPNEAAEAGTRQHLALETGDLTKLQDKWERDRVLEGQLVEQALEAEFPNARVVKELRVVGIFNDGSSDYNLFDFEAGIALINDWKMGKIAVTPVDRNLQIWNYVLNTFTMYPGIHTIHGCIFQPQVSSDLQRHVFTRDMIPMIQSRIEKVIASREDPNRQPSPDSKACMYCNQRAGCKPWQNIAQRAVREEYGLIVPDTLMSCVDQPADQVADAYTLGSMLEAQGKALKKSATARRDALLGITGEEPPGCKLVERKGSLSCTDPATMITEAIQACGMDAVYSECVSVKVTKIAAVINKSNGEYAEDIINGYLERGIVKRGEPSRYLKVSGTKAKNEKLLTEKYS